MRPAPPSTSGSSPGLAAVRGVHTVIWLVIEVCVVKVLADGFRGRSDRSTALAGAVVAGESAVFALSGLRCPLTSLARRLGAGEDGGRVTDTWLPPVVADNLPAVHVPLVALALWLHRGSLSGLRG